MLFAPVQRQKRTVFSGKIGKLLMLSKGGNTKSFKSFAGQKHIYKNKYIQVSFHCLYVYAKKLESTSHSY